MTEKKENKGKREEIESFVDKTRKDITEKIKDKYHEGEAEKIMGGKQLRGILCVLSWRAAGGKDEDYDKILETAAAVEGMHGSSLILDDIFDGDKERRGGPPLWVAEGVSDAVLTAHRVITSALDTFLNRGVEVARSVIGGWGEAVEGEKKDLGLMKRIGEEMLARETIPEEVYFNVIRKKTASFFSTAAKGGSQVAGAPKELVDVFTNFGENLGIAYQLADDLVDIKKGKIEGAAVLPLLITAKGESAVRNKIFAMLLGDKTKVGDLLKDLDINPRDFLTSNLKLYLKKAEEIAGSDIIPETEYKAILRGYPKYAVKSILKEGDIRVNYHRLKTVACLATDNARVD